MKDMIVDIENIIIDMKDMIVKIKEILQINITITAIITTIVVIQEAQVDQKTEFHQKLKVNQ